jgi:Resolvase, N terminal domain
MNDLTKIGASHLSRAAYVYLRQSTAAQVEHNRESTQRQYALAARATALGWPAQQVIVIDEDLGLSGSGVVERSGFSRLTADVALRHVGIVLGLEVSRLARNNADWYRLLDLCGLTDTLIGDADGVYHPAMFNDRDAATDCAIVGRSTTIRGAPHGERRASDTRGEGYRPCGRKDESPARATADDRGGTDQAPIASHKRSRSAHANGRFLPYSLPHRFQKPHILRAFRGETRSPASSAAALAPPAATRPPRRRAA